MKGLKKGLGIYLILFFAMFCGIIWYMNKNSKTDSGYTIVDFQAEVSEDLIGSVEIYQNKEIPTGTVYITYRQTNEEKEFYVSDVNKVQQIIMSKGNGNIRLELHDVSGQSNVWTWLPTVVLIVVLLGVVMIFMANMWWCRWRQDDELWQEPGTYVKRERSEVYIQGCRWSGRRKRGYGGDRRFPAESKEI